MARIEWFKKCKVKPYDKVLLKNYASVVAVFSSIVTILAFFFTPQEKCQKVIWFVIFLIFLIGWYTYSFCKANKKNDVSLKMNKTKVNVIVGDIFEEYGKEDSHSLNIIAVNNYFDDIVDNRIVSAETLHGKYMKKIIADNKMEKLKKTIQADRVINREGNYHDVTDRLSGNSRDYEIGSVVEFENFGLAAFTKFDFLDKAYLSAEEYTSFWMRFWQNIDEIYAGRTINIPLMGAGITRFRDGELTKQQLIENMLWTLKLSGFHNTYGDKAINFIIYSADAPEIDFYHIQHNPSFR